MLLIKKITKKNVKPKKEHVLLAKLKEECQENFDGELDVKYVKIKGCHVPQVPVPERLVHLP